MEKRHLINENYFALAWALAVSFFYALLTILLIVIPDLVISAVSTLFFVKAGAPTVVEVTFSGFILGTFEVFIVTYLLTLIFAWIYNLFVLTEINKNLKK